MIEKHIDLLGKKVVDKVTGIRGVVTSVTFDLYGCIQAIVTRTSDDEETKSDWFDVSRLRVTSKKRVMDIPDFSGTGDVAMGKKGGFEKPLR